MLFDFNFVSKVARMVQQVEDSVDPLGQQDFQAWKVTREFQDVSSIFCVLLDSMQIIRMLTWNVNIHITYNKIITDANITC